MALKKHSDAAGMPDIDQTGFAKDVRRIVLDYTRRMPRTVQTDIGPSQAGSPCDRELVYALTQHMDPGGTPQDGNPWLPLVGTAVHTEMANALKAENRRLGWERWLIEQRVEISDEIPYGTLDAFDTQEGDVVDWKIVGKTTLDSVRAKGSKPLYRKQVNLYGLGAARLGFQVNRCIVVYLPRNANPTRPFLDEMRVDAQPFDLDDALETVERLRGLKQVAKGISPKTRQEKINLVEANPSRDNCFFCDFKRVCPSSIK